jgi:nucleoid-associated protein EbfC
MDFNKIFENIIGNPNNIKEKINDLKSKLKDKTVIGSSGGNMVQVMMNGNFNIYDIKIEEVCYTDKEMLQELIKSASNDAINKAYDLLKHELLGSYSSYLNPFSNIDFFKKD